MEYKLIERDGSCFDIESLDDQLIMKYSNDDCSWTEICKGKTAVTLKSDGNGLEISIPEIKFKKYFNYGDAGSLLQALQTWSKLHEYTFNSYTLYKEIK